MTATVTSEEPKCPNCHTAQRVFCLECNNQWKNCGCGDSDMECLICMNIPDGRESQFKWAPAGVSTVYEPGDFDYRDNSWDTEELSDDEVKGLLDEFLGGEFDGEDEVSRRKRGNPRNGGNKHHGTATRQQPMGVATGNWDYGSTKNQGFHRSCHHVMTPVVLKSPDIEGQQVTIYCSAGSTKRERGTNIPDFGLYADRIWWEGCTNRNEFINWPDFKVPEFPEIARQQIIDAFIRACEGERVEIGCIGGHGRTGTILACMAVLAGYEPNDAIALARTKYCTKAVETSGQEAWVQWFWKACGFAG